MTQKFVSTKIRRYITKKPDESRFLRTMSAFIVIVVSLTVVGLVPPSDNPPFLPPQPSLLGTTSSNLALVPEMYLAETTNGTTHFALTPLTQSISVGQSVPVEILLVTDGRPFNAAVSVLTWDPNEFEFVKAEGKLKGPFLSTSLKNGLTGRILTHFAVPGDPDLITPTGQEVPYAVVTLKAKVSQLKSTLQLSTSAEDQVIHYLNDPVMNSVQQVATVPTQIQFQPTSTSSQPVMQTQAIVPESKPLLAAPALPIQSPTTLSNIPTSTAQKVTAPAVLQPTTLPTDEVIPFSIEYPTPLSQVVSSGEASEPITFWDQLFGWIRSIFQ